jgi:hypothetical protein
VDRFAWWGWTSAQTVREDGGLTRSRGLLHHLSRCGLHRRNQSPRVFGYIKGDAAVRRDEPLERMARDEELMTYRHDGFWQLIDAVREKCSREDQGHKGAAPCRRVE